MMAVASVDEAGAAAPQGTVFAHLDPVDCPCYRTARDDYLQAVEGRPGVKLGQVGTERKGRHARLT